MNSSKLKSSLTLSLLKSAVLDFTVRVSLSVSRGCRRANPQYGFLPAVSVFIGL